MTRHGAAGFSVDDVVQTRLRAPFVPQSLKELERVRDAPACVGVDPDETLVLGRHLVRITVPFEKTLVEVVRSLDERDLEMQSRRENRLAHGLAELSDDHLLGFIDDIRGAVQQQKSHENHGEAEECSYCSLAGLLCARLEGFERKERKNAFGILVEKDLAACLWQHSLHGLEVHALTRDLGRAPVRLVKRLEAFRITLAAIDPVERIALGLQNRLFGLAAGARDDLVVLGPSFVNQPVALLLCLVDGIPGGLDRVGRIHILQDDLVDRNSGVVLLWPGAGASPARLSRCPAGPPSIPR